MLEAIQQLLILQDRDIALAKALHGLKHIPKEEAAIREKLARQSARLDELKKAGMLLESERKKLELEVKSKEALIAKYGAQQLQTKKNEEYQALGHEIERARAEISALEDRELALMEQYEASQKEIAAEADNVRAYTAQAETQLAALAAKKQNFESRRSELEKAVAECEAKTDPAVLARYRRILNSKKDVALVPIEHGTTCGGCHMKLTHQIVLQAKGNQTLASCDNCGRLLYWPEA